MTLEEKGSVAEQNWRIRNLRPGFEMRPVPEHGIGMFPVNIATGSVCDCRMEWDKLGHTLSCPVCGLDGT